MLSEFGHEALEAFLELLFYFFLFLFFFQITSPDIQQVIGVYPAVSISLQMLTLGNRNPCCLKS